ncbi:MAG: helicase-related protein, partial [Moraxellaceae bacterium]
VSVLGGMPFPAQNRLLSRPYDIMVATPGRLLDHMSRGRIVFERLDMLVLDEADRMLDMGFIDDVEQIAAACPPDRQTLLFSATVEERMAKLAENLLKDPVRIAVAGHTTRHEQIEQRVYYADDMAHKKQLLLSLLGQADVNQAIVFASTRVDSDALADELAGFGIAVDSLHGDMKQTARNRTLTGLRSGRTKVLVATDVAARGIDVPGISHVVNYDLPKNAEDYVHRIGRTGRAGRTGLACSLVGPRDRGVLRRIEQFINQSLPVAMIEGLEPKRRDTADRPRRSAGDKPRWGHKDRQARNERQERRPYGDRPARAAGERAPVEGGERRAPRSEGFGERRAPRQDGFGEYRRRDQAPRAARESFDDERQPLDNSNRSVMETLRSDGFVPPAPRRHFGDRRPQGDRPARGSSQWERKPRESGFGERRGPSAGRDYAPRKPRDDSHGNKRPGDRPRRPLDDSFGNR